MKLIAIALLLITLEANANNSHSVYQSESKLIKELRVEVIEAVLKKFPCIDNFGLTEELTSVSVEQIDQGVEDLYFKTVFKADFQYDNHPNTAEVRVESVRYDGSSPTIDWTEVLTVKGSVLCD
jgi:hypothetical protein